jgi:hypothetical protein
MVGFSQTQSYQSPLSSNQIVLGFKLWFVDSWLGFPRRRVISLRSPQTKSFLGSSCGSLIHGWVCDSFGVRSELLSFNLCAWKHHHVEWVGSLARWKWAGGQAVRAVGLDHRHPRGQRGPGRHAAAAACCRHGRVGDHADGEVAPPRRATQGAPPVSNSIFLGNFIPFRSTVGFKSCSHFHLQTRTMCG